MCRMCSGAARYKLVLCTHQTTRPKLPSITLLMSKNSSWSNPVSVPTWSRLFPSLYNAPDAHKFTQLKFDVLSISTSVKLKGATMCSCLQIFVRCVRSDFQVLLHRDWFCAVRGLRVPHWSAVRKRPLKQRFILLFCQARCGYS